MACEPWCPCRCNTIGCGCHPSTTAALAASGALEGTVPCATCQTPARVLVVATAGGNAVTATMCPACDTPGGRP